MGGRIHGCYRGEFRTQLELQGFGWEIWVYKKRKKIPHMREPPETSVTRQVRVKDLIGGGAKTVLAFKRSWALSISYHRWSETIIALSFGRAGPVRMERTSS